MNGSRPGVPITTSLLGLALLVAAGCSGSRHLETRLGGRAMEDLRAEARRVDGGWRVELLLPAGQWKVEPQEGQPWDLLPNEPRATLRWTVTLDRWSRQDRPFRFDLVGASGLRLSLAVVYPNTLPKAAEVVLQIFRGSIPI